MRVVANILIVFAYWALLTLMVVGGFLATIAGMVLLGTPE